MLDRIRVAFVAPSLRILGGQAVQADRLLTAWKDDPDVDAWLVPSEQSRELALLAQRNMNLQVNRQDGIVWVGDGDRSVEIHPRRLSAEPR